jgi:histidinol phosphatase-like PHP family hydrolase
MHVFEIDLHYHAGQERRENKSLRDYIDFAHMTGRKILGITDHDSRYGTRLREGPQHYPQSIEGMMQYRQDLDELRSDFPSMQIFFAPELSSVFEYKTMDDRIIDISDYFICEPASNHEEMELYTELMISELERTKAIANHTGKPTYMAHPFRYRLLNRISEGRTLPEGYMGACSMTDEEVMELIGLDIVAFADHAVSLGVAIEINGGTHYRLRSFNAPYYLDALRHAFKILHRRGVSLVPASDLHGFAPGQSGLSVPRETFEMLGITAKDIGFLNQIGAKVE